MKTFRHILFNALVVQSLLLGVATAVLWVRSYDVGDQLTLSQMPFEKWPKGSNDFRYHTQVVKLSSGCGGMGLAFFAHDENWRKRDMREQSYWSYDYQANASPRYPGSLHHDLSRQWGGFGYGSDQGFYDLFDASPQVIGSSSSTNRWLWFPLWFPLLLSLILPAIWLVRWRRGRAVRRNDPPV